MRNAFEKRVAVKLGQEWEYEKLKLTYTVTHTYLADFNHKTRKAIVEAKGYFPPEDRRKMKAVREQYPEYEITISFTNPHKTISKQSKTTYAAWCEKNGFKWEQGPMPVKRSKRK